MINSRKAYITSCCKHFSEVTHLENWKESATFECFYYDYELRRRFIVEVKNKRKVVVGCESANAFRQ